MNANDTIHRASHRRATNRCRLAALALSLIAGAALAAPSVQAERETQQLIQALGRSGCQFERNGSWYDAAEAQQHLSKKLAYLRKRDQADTAESFIERGASQSSVSGKPYHVRCGKGPTQTSADWLRARLVQLRAAGGATPPSP
ncbi:MAG: DUF5329 domain-containing protein [Lysobacter sp.]